MLRHFVEAAGDDRMGIIRKGNAMKRTRIIVPLLAFFLLLLCQSVKAQAPFERSKQITKIGSKEYYMHTIKAGQTFEQVTDVYNVTKEEIIRFNPEMKNGLKVGYVIGIPVRPLKVVESEPEPEPVPEPEPIVEEPVVEEPEPVIVEPEPEPVIEEPTLEPVVTEPEPEPVVVEPEPEPIVVEPEPEPVTVEPEPEPIVDEPEPESEPVVNQPEPAVVKVGGHYVVQTGEDLYDIAKKFGIDVSDFKAVNPNLTANPYEGMTISVPNIVNENDYIVHKVEFNERTSSMLKRWKVDEAEFRAMNVSVGSHVFVNQAVLIPIDPIKPEREVVDEPMVEEIETPTEEPVVSEEPEPLFIEPLETPECYADLANASQRYKVALLIPLYLSDVSSIEISKNNLPRLQKERSLAFLPFYEGFMMAVEKMTNEQGLKLDLTVMDVTDNVNTAHRALERIENQHFDLIVGPFFGKSFAIIEEYAKAHDIILVNPLSTRNEVIEGNANVVKLKPSRGGQILDIAYLVRNRYPDANVFILSREKVADSLFLSQLEHDLNLAVNDEVTVSGNDFMQFARSESQRLEMGSRLVSTITVEGQVYSTNDLQNGSLDHVVLANPVHRYVYSPENINSIISQLSGVRDNVIVAYGDDNVFATQVLNTLKKEADRFPITLVCGPDWTQFEKLLVENLLQMNAIYLTDNFVDYRSPEVKSFVLDFRSRYAVEPQDYAFEGYDVATYFLTALMRYGNGMSECLPYFTMPLMHTRYHFMRKGMDNGLENQSWSLYQYDNVEIELVPVDPFKKAVE